MSEAKTKVGGVDADRLRSIIERIERLEEERKALAQDVKDIKQEAKSAGYSLKAINALLAERKQDPVEVEQLESDLDIYRRALGGYADTPLAKASEPRKARKGKPEEIEADPHDPRQGGFSRMTVQIGDDDPIELDPVKLAKAGKHIREGAHA